MDVVLEGIVSGTTDFTLESEIGHNIFSIPLKPEIVQLTPSESEEQSFDRQAVIDYVKRDVRLLIYQGHCLPITQGDRIRVDFHESQASLVNFQLPLRIRTEKIYLLSAKDGSVASAYH